MTVLDLKPLTASLKNVKAVELRCDKMEPMLTVLPRAVEELSLGYNNTNVTFTGLAAALRVCHCLQSLRIEARKYDPTLWTELNSVLNSNRLTELHLKDTEIFDDEPAAPPSMETLKNLLVHREKCTLEMKLNDPQLSALLSGLKRADKLKELHLIIRVSNSEVNPNQWLVTCAEVEELVTTHPHLMKVHVNNSGYLDKLLQVNLLTAVAKGAIRNKNITNLGLGSVEILAVHPLLCSPSADHITSIRTEYYGFYNVGQSEGVIAGSMARQTCHLDLWRFTPAPMGLLLSRVNTATKLKDLSLKVESASKEDDIPVDVRAVETAFTNCNLRKLRIEHDEPSGQWYRLYSAILNGLAANTTTQVDSCIYSYKGDSSIGVEEITRHLSQQTLQRFEVVKTGLWSCFISRDPSCPSAPVPAPDPLLNTPSQPTSSIAKPETTPPGQATPTHQTTPPDPPPTPPDVGELLEKYKTRILSDVMSGPIFNRLEVEKVISDSVALEISKTTNREGNCLIYKHLMEQSDLKSLQTFSTVLAEEEGNAKMQRLGEDLLAEITLLHGCP